MDTLKLLDAAKCAGNIESVKKYSKELLKTEYNEIARLSLGELLVLPSLRVKDDFTDEFEESKHGLTEINMFLSPGSGDSEQQFFAATINTLVRALASQPVDENAALPLLKDIDTNGYTMKYTKVVRSLYLITIAYNKEKHSSNLQEILAAYLSAVPDSVDSPALLSLVESALYRAVRCSYKHLATDGGQESSYSDDVDASLHAVRTYLTLTKSAPANWRNNRRASALAYACYFLTLAGLQPSLEYSETLASLDKYISSLKFPTANAAHTPLVDLAASILYSAWLHHGRQHKYIKDLKSRFYRWSSRTFQSIQILNHIIILSIADNSHAESHEAIQCFLELIEKIRHLSARSSSSSSSVAPSFDLQQVIRTLILSIEVYTQLYPDHSNAQMLADTLTLWLSDNAVAAAIPPELHSEALVAIGNAQLFASLTDVAYKNRSELLLSAENSYRKAINIHSATKPLYQLSFLLAESGKLNEAVKFIRLALKNDPNSIPSWHLLILILSASNDVPAALTACTRVLESITAELPSLADRQAIVELKITQLTLEEVQSPGSALSSASELFEFISKLYSDRSQTLDANTGAVELASESKQKRFSLALRRSSSSLKRLTDLKPHGASEKTSFGGKLLDAVDSSFQKSLRNAWIFVGSQFRKHGSYDEAKQALQEASLCGGPGSDILTEYGYLYLTQKRLDSARTEFELALLNSRDHVPALLGMATSLMRDKKFQHSQALSILETATRLSEQYSETWWMIATVYETVGMNDKAAEALKRCITLENYKPVRSWNVIQPRLM
ncbi:hypothetical protein CANCADRAFT_46233 [Tortispora caseinolytica NRRL Y-17796]|uniref:Cargo-transport protein YPP1 n=1 Tax=Tortispora caseinolytica NRRL Y-17796 TaxID=767744 RepID=A0A1E4T9L0_9ASCO|nr:hypothetical protein CANCADRAFT_46233 [Tortispora caseinolytica NRRL Y-17796]